MTVDNVSVTYKRYFRIMRRDLVYLKFIMEAYEGVATLSTADKRNGIVEVTYSGFFAATVDELLKSISGDISLTEVTPSPSDNRLFH